jgi:hypothetical protein
MSQICKCPICKESWLSRDPYDSLQGHMAIFHPNAFGQDNEKEDE